MKVRHIKSGKEGTDHRRSGGPVWRNAENYEEQEPYRCKDIQNNLQNNPRSCPTRTVPSGWDNWECDMPLQRKLLAEADLDIARRGLNKKEKS